MRVTIIAVVIAAIVGYVLGIGTNWSCHRKSPAAIATTAETTYIHSTDTTPGGIVIHYRPDPAASKELERLRAQVTGQENSIAQLLTYTGDLELERDYLIDSFSRLALDTLRGMIRLTRGPAGIAVETYRAGRAQRFTRAIWRERFTVTAGSTEPHFHQPRFPLDVGAFAAGGLVSDPTEWAPKYSLWAGLQVKRAAWTFSAGPQFDGRLSVRAEARVSWWWF